MIDPVNIIEWAFAVVAVGFGLLIIFLCLYAIVNIVKNMLE